MPARAGQRPASWHAPIRERLTGQSCHGVPDRARGGQSGAVVPVDLASKGRDMQINAVRVALSNTRNWSNTGLSHSFPVGSAWRDYEHVFQSEQNLPGFRQPAAVLVHQYGDVMAGRCDAGAGRRPAI